METTSQGAYGDPAAPTLSDVASLAGVSRATASRVINDVPAVSPEARRRVKRAVATLGYVPNAAAAALARRRRSRSIDLGVAARMAG